MFKNCYFFVDTLFKQFLNYMIIEVIKIKIINYKTGFAITQNTIMFL